MPGNVLVNNVLTVLLEQLLGGVIAIVVSSTVIVLAGEIIPQSVFGRHPLWTGAHAIWPTWVFLVLFYPVTKPVAMVCEGMNDV